MDIVIFALSVGTLICVGIALQINHSFMKTQRETNLILVKDIEALEKDIKRLEKDIKVEIQLRRVLDTDVRRNEGAIHEAAEWAHNVDLFVDTVCESDKRVKEKFNNRVAAEKGVNFEPGVNESNDKPIGQEEKTTES